MTQMNAPILDGTRATFSYDSTSQIISEARGGTMTYARSYGWDPLGNRSQQYDSGALTQDTFNAANQQTLITPPSGPPTTQSFDNAGNLTLEQTGAARVTSTWSPTNRLASYADNLGNSVSGLYSDDGLRRQRTVNGTTANLTYDESVLLLETDTSGNLDARYTNAPETWGTLVSQNRSGTSSYFGFDTQGSARVIVSSAGLVTDARSWRAFGEPIQTGSGTVTPYGHVANAAYYTELAVLFNAWHRWAKPSAGQWRSVDPIGFTAGPYNYGTNNPIDFSDPAGLAPQGGPAIPIYGPPYPGTGADYPTNRENSGSATGPRPGIGKGECPGDDAVQFALYVLHGLRACGADFKRLCNGQSLAQVLSKINFIVRPHCDPDQPDNPCATLLPKGHPANPGVSCSAVGICFNESECGKSNIERAQDLLFEIANWCNCNYHKLSGGEGPAEIMCIHCGYPPKMCHGGTYPVLPK